MESQDGEREAQAPGWLVGGGEMGARIRAYDWAATPLGPIEGWPPSLHTAVDLLLAARQPVYVAWGPELTSLYNDGYIPILGAKHPGGLGRPYAELFAEIWDEYRPLTEATLAGEAQYFVDRPVPLVGRGDDRTSYFTFSWTPLRDKAGRVAGFYCAATETTEKVRAEEALRASEETYRTLFDSIDEGFCLFELLYEETGKAVDYRFLDVNRVFERQTGLVNVTGTLGSASAPGTESYWLETYDRVARTGHAQRIEYYHQTTGRWYAAYASRVGGAGSRRVCTVFADVTERKQREEQQAFLLLLSDTLRPLTDPVTIQEAATHVLGTHLDVDRTYYVEIDDTRQVAVVARDYVRGEAPSLAGEHPLAPFGSMLRVIRAGRTFVADDAETDPALRADLADYRARALRAFVAVPLVKDGALVAAMCVTSAAPRRWTDVEVSLVEETAERTWAALERGRAEAGLHASEARFRSFAEASADTLWIVDAATQRLEYLSPAFERMWGEPRDAVMRDLGRWAELVHPEDREQAGRVLPRALAGEAIVADYRIVRPADGAVRWIRDTGFPLRDAAGRVARVAGIAQDITDQKAIETALRASEARQAFLLALSDALRPLADPGEIQAAATALLRDRLDVGWCYYVELDEEALSTVVLRDAVRDGVPSMVGVHDVSEVPEFLDFLRSGQMFDVGDFARYELVSRPVRDRYMAIGVRSMLGTPVIKGGRLVAWLQVCDTRPRDWPAEAATLLREVADRTWDALQRARAEAALREAHATLEARVVERTAELAAAVEGLRASEGRLRLLVEQMPAALWTTDADLHITALMGAAVPTSARASIGQAMPDFLFADVSTVAGATASVEAHRRALAGVPGGFEAETAAHTYAGHVEPLRDGGGRIVGVIGVAHDVTERALLRLQDEFLALASHELRTPITPALGYLDMLPHALAAGDAERAARYIALARGQLAHLASLVGDLLDVGRLRGGQLHLDSEEIDLTAVVRRAIQAAQVEAEAQGQTIALHAPTTPVRLRGDARRLQQVMLNLLINAVRHAPQSESIDVRLRRDTRAREAVLTVRDDGPGIPEEDLPHLFSRFYQVARPDRPARGGLGLGLYLVKELAEAHGGTVEVASALGQGSTFTVRLPLAAPTRPTKR